MKALTMWRASKGEPLLFRLFCLLPWPVALGLAGAIRFIATRLNRLDQFCRHCRAGRRRYGLVGFVRRVYNGWSW